MRKLKLVYLLPTLGQPRHQKRILNLSSYFECARILYIERRYLKPLLFPRAPIRIGKMVEGKYFSRILFSPVFSYRIYRQLSDCDVIYCFGFDMLLFAVISSRVFGTNKRKIIYEVGDLRKIQGETSYEGRLFRWVERFLLNRVSLLVVTSHMFYETYYQSLSLGQNLQWIEAQNKVDLCVINKQCKPLIMLKKEKVKVGYIGLLRCEFTIRLIKELVCKYRDEFEIHVWGKITLPLKNDFYTLVDSRKIYFHGEYTGDDLASIYSSVHYMISYYPLYGGGGVNRGSARTNRFYESGAFKTPQISATGTVDGEYVSSCDIGICLDTRDVVGAADVLKRKCRERHNHYVDNLNGIDADMFVDTHKQIHLARKIDELFVCADRHEE